MAASVLPVIDRETWKKYRIGQWLTLGVLVGVGIGAAIWTLINYLFDHSAYLMSHDMRVIFCFCIWVILTGIYLIRMK
jgi:hypothetical protein